MSEESKLDLIERQYTKYIESYPKESLLTIQFPEEEIDYPLRHSIKEGTEMIYDSEDAPDREYLLEWSDDLPNITDLSPETLSELPIHLTYLAQAKVTKDHRGYWKETYQRSQEFFEGSYDSDNMLRIFKVVTVLACWQTATPEGEEASFLQKQSYLMASYIVYPLLEAVASGICAEELDPMTGRVRPGGQIRKLSQEEAFYTHDDIVSDIGALLLHIEQEIGNKDIEKSMVEMRSQIAQFGNKSPNEAYGILKDWRNDLSHGTIKPTGQFIIVLNMVCLLLWKMMLYPGEWFSEVPSHLR